MSDDAARRSPTASLRSHTIPRLVPVCGHGAWCASARSLSIAEQCATRGYHDRNLTDRRAGGSAGASVVIVMIKNRFCRNWALSHCFFSSSPKAARRHLSLQPAWHKAKNYALHFWQGRDRAHFSFFSKSSTIDFFSLRLLMFFAR